MLDQYNREINYLRISVTDKCNLRCIYCMPENGIELKSHNEILRFEEIVLIAKEAVKLGINKVRITGGEPLVRKNLENLIAMLSNIKGIEQLSLTTNGTLLADKAKTLKEAGIDSINISLDTLDPDRYKYITRGGNIVNAIKGIDAAVKGNIPLKINMVVIKGINEDEVDNMREFCRMINVELQLINHFSLNSDKQDVNTFDRPPKCGSCNRIRLLSDGILKPCLHSDIEYKVNLANISECLKQTIMSKPEKGITCSSKQMVEIGG